jgi:hypothetical protein
MANYNGIEFNNVKQYGNFVSAGPLRIQGLDGTDLDDGTGIINAIDIDWNGAKLPNVSLSYLQNNNTINTSGDLLALINDMQGQINVLAELVTSYMG